MWQVTRASRNNVFGAFFPTMVVPISGPVLGTDSFESAWGTATGLLFAAEVFDFGRRASLVTEARAGQTAAEAHAEAARLDASVRAAELHKEAAAAAPAPRRGRRSAASGRSPRWRTAPTVHAAASAWPCAPCRCRLGKLWGHLPH